MRSSACLVCNKQILSSNLKRHMVQKHSPVVENKILSECTICNKIILLRNFKVHMILKHSPIVYKEQKCSTTKCTICSKVILFNNLKRHLIQKHSPTVKKEKKRSTNCEECNKAILVRSLKLHMILKHSSNVEEKRCFTAKCTVCSKMILSKNLKRHMLLKHNPNFDDKREFMCYLCNDKKYTSKQSLIRHKEKVHHLTTALRMKCPLCKFIGSFMKADKQNSIYKHFESKHGISMKYETHHFESIEEFYAWKYNIEKLTISKFTIQFKKPDRLVFRCHRSGKYVPKRCIKRKIMGSVKINGFCPASIRAKIVNHNEVTVTFQQAHVGHQNELRYISLTTEERKAIADQLANKIPHDEILKEIRGTLTNSQLQRIHLTTKKDIQNIEKSYLKAKESYNSFKIS